MKPYTVEEIHARMHDFGYTILDFHLVGIRSKEDKPDAFDDLLYVIDTEIKQAVYFTCTTNPGVHWLQNVLNPKGAAVLCPGQYLNTWAIGKHKGLYEALVQQRPVTVLRDNDKDLKSGNSGTKDTGMFGINIHHASESIVSVVNGKWSAGCQVLNNPKQFQELLTLCKRSGKGQFTYTLLNEF